MYTANVPRHELAPTKVSPVRRVTILGGTGSIGASTLRIIDAQPERFTVTAITAHTEVDELIRIARQYKPSLAVIADETHFNTLKQGLSGTGIKVASGAEGLLEAVTLETDIVMSAIVGAAALAPTLEAIRQGKRIALANKECLVMAGTLLMAEAKKCRAHLLPVDSEHNAIYQLIAGKQIEDISTITLTASGGPFRTWSIQEMEKATRTEALKHPNWSMGDKITIDSATMMNKGLEWIEACHLFPLSPTAIQLVVHPESIIHGIVCLKDGTSFAQMNHPDMRVPIAHALAWPARMEVPLKPLNIAEIGSLTFQPVDTQRFPAITLARQAYSEGGAMPAILNAVNEVAVHAFLQEKIAFTEIVGTVATIMEQMHIWGMKASLEGILQADKEARQYAHEAIAKRSA